MEPLPLAVFSSYFLLIIALFVFILRDLRFSWLDSTSRKPASIFFALAAASFAHTWFYMFKFMHWSFSHYEDMNSFSSNQPMVERLSSWLANTQLFEQAWYAVCFPTNANWWWSEQLCLFTVGAWTVFLTVQGNTHKIRHVWAYMLLGQLVAISVASNLFYAALILKSRSGKEDHHYAPPVLWISVLLSLASVAALPLTDHKSFLPNLLFMHALIVLPLLMPAGPAAYGMEVKHLYLLSNLICTYLRVRSNLKLEHKSFDFLWTLLHSHPAQSSIGWDVIWTSMSFLVWYINSARISTTTLFSAATIPVLSVGVAAPYIWAQQINIVR